MEDPMNQASPQTAATQGCRRSPFWAVILSVAATGLGHIYCGRLLKGLILFFAGFAFAPIIVITAQNAASPWMLAVVIASLLLLAGIFFYALVDAGLLARRIGRDYQIKEYNRWYIYLLFIIVALSYPTNLASSIRDNVLQAFRIPAPSMAPGILRGDSILLNKAIYKIKAPARGDVVVFIYPDDRRRYYIKRIVALPGDTIEIRDNKIIVNDRPLTYNSPETAPALNFNPGPEIQALEEENHGRRYPILINGARTADLPKTTVPHGACFVLGDNRTQSKDSRTFGPVPLADIKGRVDYIYWPAVSWSRFGKFNG
jgi:signal peptidase I